MTLQLVISPWFDLTSEKNHHNLVNCKDILMTLDPKCTELNRQQNRMVEKRHQ